MIPGRRWQNFEVLTFDCYGTLIDWEIGILEALRPILKAHGVKRSDKEILELYAAAEAKAEEGAYVPYRAVLRGVMGLIAESLGFKPSPQERERLAETLKDWKPFPDTVGALRALKRRFKLAVISNVDDDLFAQTARHLEVPFDWVITAQQVGSYKPSPRNFIYAIERIEVPYTRVLHVAQSLFHDIAPAKALGLTTVWVNRRKGKEGFGATVPGQAQPDLEVPDLKTLAEIAGCPVSKRQILPRILRPGLRVVFVGFNPGRISAARGHYYANPANRFYALLHSSGLTRRRFKPEEDRRLLERGIGFTDLCPWKAGQPEVLTPQDIARGRWLLLRRLRRAGPRVVAFTGLTLFKLVFGRSPRPGLQPERIGLSRVFALPSSSGRANGLWRERLRSWRSLARGISTATTGPGRAPGARVSAR